MRILILTGIFPPDIGGPATQLDALIRELLKENYQVKVLTFGQLNRVQYPYPVKKVSNQWPSYLKSLAYLINGFYLALKADVIYSQDLYTAGLTSLIIKKILRKPLVTRFVGDSAWETAVSKGWTSDDIVTFQEKKYSWKIEMRKKIRKKILINSDRVIVVSYFLRDLAQKIGISKEKIKVIYNSVDFLDVEKNLQKPSFKGIMILTIARLTPWKGIDMLIEIMPDLIRDNRNINLVVLGSGKELKKLQQLVKSLHLEDSVFFQGKLEREQTINYLQSANLFVLNSNYEGMSHCLLEAMKIGVPIITTKSGGNPETIRDGQTGLLVDYKNKEQWLKAINLILSDQELANRLAGQAKKDLSRFGWSNLVRETINVFQSL